MPHNLTHLTSNEFLSGGLVLGAIAGAVALARHYLMLGLAALRRRFVVEIEVREWDMVMWLGLWLSHTDYGQRCRKLTTRVLQEGGVAAKLFFEPGLGAHVFRYRGVFVLVERQVEEKENVWNRREWYSVWVLGSRNVATKLIDDAKTFGNELLARRHTAFISNGAGEWDRLGVGAPRELDSVILPGNTAQDVAGRVKTFLARREWYVERGVPWRIGFGLFGPPRTGKTSLVRAVARELQLPMYVLDLTGEDLTDRNLIVSLAKVPIGAIVLVEDIDAQIGGESPSKVTLSGLLNALDGPLASEGRVLFVTSNAPEKLDAALMGEGRIDVHVQFSYATREQVVGMFLRFFPCCEVQATAFAEAVPAGVLPPAAIQEHLIARCDDAARAVADAHLLGRKEVRVVRRDVAA